MPLPPLPRHKLELLEERRVAEDGFMRIRRQTLRVKLACGSVSDSFEYDIADRTRLDAVVMAAHFLDEHGVRFVFLRSSLRPPVAARPIEVRPYPEKETLGALWELPAGLVELDERTPEGLLRCAARELLEEVGFEVDPAALAPLGPSSFPSPGMCGERHFFFHVEVDPARRTTPTEDGSPLERNALVVAIALDEALSLARAGEIEDAKTELGLRRLTELELREQGV